MADSDAWDEETRAFSQPQHTPDYQKPSTPYQSTTSPTFDEDSQFNRNPPQQNFEAYPPKPSVPGWMIALITALICTIIAIIAVVIYVITTKNNAPLPQPKPIETISSIPQSTPTETETVMQTSTETTTVTVTESPLLEPSDTFNDRNTEEPDF